MSINHKKREQLLRTARQSINYGATHDGRYEVEHGGLCEEFLKPRATFVTLHANGQLRGCIGNLLPEESLVDSIAHNAHGAAFNDPRFPPVESGEIEGLTIHLSLLNDSEPIRFVSEEELLSQLRPDIDGLILNFNHHRATFLPSVWQQLSNPVSFLGHLKCKAGLTEHFWHPDIQVERYTVEEFGEG